MLRSEPVQRLLRFQGEIEVCQGCNTLENAWKKGSNRRRKDGGFLPKSFSLTPQEIAAIRQKHKRKGNNHPDVGADIWTIWRRQRRMHKRRSRLVVRTADLFEATLA